MAQFNFSLHYRASKKSVHADALSRLHAIEEVSLPIVQAVCQQVSQFSPIEAFGMVDTSDGTKMSDFQKDDFGVVGLSSEDWVKFQISQGV